MRTGALWTFVALLGVSVAAQQPRPRFDVASVKPVGEPPLMSLADVFSTMPRALPGGRFNPAYATVEHLLTFAYTLKPNRLVGGPDWTRRDFFQINATAGGDASAEQIKLMVQSLLEDRFKLVTHVEPREMRFLALVHTRPDGPPGPGLTRIDECTAARVNELRRTFPAQYPLPMNGLTGSCSNSGVDTLADALTIGLDTPVIDATGLTGSFYYNIRSHFRFLPPAFAAAAVDPDLPALSTALEEQLGLRLESRRGPVDVLVIDSVQQPTEN